MTKLMGKTMKLPTRKTCLELLKKYKVPKNICAHILCVNKACLFLAKKARDEGIAINEELLDRASLLHDILRVCNFKETEQELLSKFSREEVDMILKLRKKYGHLYHGDAAKELFKDEYPEMAELIAKHGMYSLREDALHTWEEKLLEYSDLRVLHQTIVSLDERMKDSFERHGYKKRAGGFMLWKKRYELAKKLETDICTAVCMKPEELFRVNR